MLVYQKYLDQKKYKYQKSTLDPITRDSLKSCKAANQYQEQTDPT